MNSPAISSMINESSLEQGHFPDVWKGGIVKPKLKKPGLELEKKKELSARKQSSVLA